MSPVQTDFNVSATAFLPTSTSTISSFRTQRLRELDEPLEELLDVGAAGVVLVDERLELLDVVDALLVQLDHLLQLRPELTFQLFRLDVFVAVLEDRAQCVEVDVAEV